MDNNKFIVKNLNEISIQDFNELMSTNNFNLLIKKGGEDLKFSENVFVEAYYNLMQEYHINYKNEYDNYLIDLEKNYALLLCNVILENDPMLKLEMTIKEEELKENTKKGSNTKNNNRLEDMVSFLSLRFSINLDMNMSANMFYTHLKTLANNPSIGEKITM